MKDSAPFRPDAPQGEFPDALLERYLLGELPPHLREPIRLRLAADAGLRARLETLERSNQDVLERYPNLGFLARRAAGQQAQAPSVWNGLRNVLRPGAGFPWMKAALPAFATLALAAVLVRQDRRDVPEAPSQGNVPVTEAAAQPGVRLKGLEAGLAIYRKIGRGTELVPPQGSVRAGDTLQIFYQSFQDLHAMIFSVDGRGSVTLHLPEEGGTSAPLTQGGLRPLPHAYLLDQAPRMERFYLITSPQPFPTDSLLAFLRPALLPTRPLPDTLEGLPPGFRQYSYTLRKENPAPFKSKPAGNRRGG